MAETVVRAAPAEGISTLTCGIEAGDDLFFID